MEKVIAHIESNGGRLYSIYVEQDLPFHLIGDGFTIEEAVENFLEVYRLTRADHLEETGQDVELSFEFVMDASAVLQKYKGVLSLAGLSRLLGINKAQLSQYVCGTRKPSPQTEKKIKEGIKKFAEELSGAFA